MKKDNKSIRIFTDFALCTLAVIVLNIVTQFLVYPSLERRMGDDNYGQMLYLLGIESIVGSSIGSAIANTRLVNANKGTASNGDYWLAAVLFCLLVFPITTLLANSQQSMLFRVSFGVLCCFMLLRNFMAVEFRLQTNFVKFLLMYLSMSAFLLVGSLFYSLSNSWVLCFLLSEGSAVIFVSLWGRSIFQGMKPTSNSRAVSRECSTLAGSYLLNTFALNLDRILLLHLINPVAVSVYYVAAVLGKTLAMVAGPINSVVLSYIHKYDITIRKREFTIVVLLLVIMMAVFSLGCAVLGPAFIKILYPSLLEQVSRFLLLASIAQILYFTTNILLVVILSFSPARWQFRVQLVYVIVLSIFEYFGASHGLYYFSIAVAFVNILFFGLTVALGYWNLSNQRG